MHEAAAQGARVQATGEYWRRDALTPSPPWTPPPSPGPTSQTLECVLLGVRSTGHRIWGKEPLSKEKLFWNNSKHKEDASGEYLNNDYSISHPLIQAENKGELKRAINLVMNQSSLLVWWPGGGGGGVVE